MIKIGLIGCGDISCSYAEGWSGVDKSKARVVATADSIEERAKRRAEQLGAESYYTDYEELLARDDIDGVNIFLPHHLHAEATIKSAEHRKHVMCIKPIARNLEEAREMIEACRANKVILQIGHQMKFSSRFTKIKEMLDSEIIGRMFLIRSMLAMRVLPTAGMLEEFPEEKASIGGGTCPEVSLARQTRGLHEFHRKRSLIGGGTLISLGVHYLDLFRWFAGEIKRVSYVGNSFISGVEGEDTAVMSLEFENGVVGDFICSWATTPAAEFLWIYGSKGAITTQDEVQFIDVEGNITKPDIVPDDRWHLEIEHFIDCIAQGKIPLVSGEEGYESLKIPIAAYKSERERRIIDLSEL